jgi:hypothetical protein
VLLSVLGVVGVRDATPTEGVAGAIGTGTEVPATAGWHNAIDGTDRWDAAWFIRIADDGYRTDDASSAFFPAYPLAITIADEVLPGGTLGAALLVSNLAFLGALIVLFALTSAEYSEAVARRTVVLVTCFPTSFFLLAPYSDSLFLFATLLAFWWVSRDRWLLAGSAGAAAAATRAIGVVIVPALLLMARPQRLRGRLPRLAGCFLPLAGPLAYALYWWQRNGSPLQMLHAQSSWMRELRFPLLTAGDALSLGIQGIGDPRGIYWTADLVVPALLLVPLVFGWRRIRAPYLVYVGLSLIVPLTYPLAARPFLSLPRFVVVLFPLFWPIAWMLRSRTAYVVTAAVSLIGFAVLSIAFMNWGFIF